MSEETVFTASQLPRRLRQVHELLVRAESEKRIARLLGISPHTVHDHVKKLYKRIGATSRAEYLMLTLPSNPPGPYILPQVSRVPDKPKDHVRPSGQRVLLRRLSKVSRLLTEANRCLTNIMYLG